MGIYNATNIGVSGFDSSEIIEVLFCCTDSSWLYGKHFADSGRIAEVIGRVERDFLFIPFTSEGRTANIDFAIVEKRATEDEVVEHIGFENESFDFFDTTSEAEFG